MTPEEAVDELLYSLGVPGESCEGVRRSNPWCARVLAMMQPQRYCPRCGEDLLAVQKLLQPRDDPAATAASALADVQAIRDARHAERLASLTAPLTQETLNAPLSGPTVRDAVSDRLVILEQSIRDAFESYKLLRERVAALEAR